MEKKRVIIVGGGFAGLNAAKALGKSKDVDVLLIDRRNHHLFQPLLYQVAMAALSPAEIAAPIRGILSRYRNIRVIQGEVTGVDLDEKSVHTDSKTYSYDYLILACGAVHSYFGNEGWEEFAPGLKTVEQATEIRRRVLTAFEAAERADDPEAQKRHLTFVIVGGGPTGVELAGAIGEMSRFTLARDFRNIDPKLTRIILVEMAPRILPAFSAEMAARAVRDLERLGVQVWTSSRITGIDGNGVEIGDERVQAATVLWAAGVEASGLGGALGVAVDDKGRVKVGQDLSIAGHGEVFVLGDQARFETEDGGVLPGLAPVALQQGRYVGGLILGELKGRRREPFHYFDKGQMATIGRSSAIVETGGVRFGGFFAWLTWLVIHIYYLTGFRNRLLVLINWAWSYMTFNRGARLIVPKEWRMFANEPRAERQNGPRSGI